MSYFGSVSRSNGGRDFGVEVVLEHSLRHPAHGGERFGVGADPVGQRLAEGGLGLAWFEAQSTGAKIFGLQVSPVRRSATATVPSRKSKIGCAPAVGRMEAATPWSHSPSRSPNRQKHNPSGS
jgi:hypothetical protein